MEVLPLIVVLIGKPFIYYSSTDIIIEEEKNEEGKKMDGKRRGGWGGENHHMLISCYCRYLINYAISVGGIVVHYVKANASSKCTVVRWN